MQNLIDEGPRRFNPGDQSAAYTLGQLAMAKNKKMPATVCSPESDSTSKEQRQMADRFDLITGHAYAIVDVDLNSQKIKLFNPWGYDQPNNNGWLKIEDFKRFFIEVDING